MRLFEWKTTFRAHVSRRSGFGVRIRPLPPGVLVVGLMFPAQLLSSQELFSADIQAGMEEAVMSWSQTPWRLGEVMLRIGAYSEQGETQLYRVAGARRLSDGSVAVANGGTTEVFFFDEEGHVLTRIGGRGGGPGEFIHISAFGWFPGDSSFVWDYPAGRVSIFSNLGDLGRSVNLRQIAPADYGPHGALSGGELVLASGRAMVGGGSAAADSTQVLVIEPGVESVDTLGRFPKRDMGQPAGSLIFSAPVILRARGSLIVWGQATEFRLLLFSGTEAEPFQAEIQHEPMMVRREDHERYKKHFVENLRGQRTDLPALRRQAEAALEGSTYAERLPAFRNILISDDQLVWVEEYRFPWVATRLWQVFNAEGTWISRMEVPVGFRLLDVGEDWALGLTRGPFDEEVIEVRKVVRDRR